MQKIFLIFLLFPLLMFGNLTWGRKGHRVTGHIAEKHLSRKAKRAIKGLLQGHSLAFASTYADEIKSDRSYDAYYPWHYVNYELNETYTDSEKNPDGDIVFAIDSCKKVLNDEKADRTKKIFHLKMLIHLIGDLHQPLHAGRGGDRGGNDIQVQWFNEGSNIHKVWDTNLLETYGMSFSELGDELDRTTSKNERNHIQQGNVSSWLAESHSLAKEIYNSVEVGEKLGYSYSYKYNAVVLDQLKKGGFRLAHVLNEIFD